MSDQITGPVTGLIRLFVAARRKSVQVAFTIDWPLHGIGLQTPERVAMEKVEGAWVGRLIDVGGFEGQVNLTLQKSKGALEGYFDAAIDGQHRPVRIRGKISGKQTGSEVVLMLDLGQQDSTVAISLEGDVYSTRRGELAVCGRYAVSTRRNSPLMAGVISLRQPTTDARPDEGLVRSVVANIGTGVQQPAAPAGPMTKPRRGRRATASSRTRRKS